MDFPFVYVTKLNYVFKLNINNRKVRCFMIWLIIIGIFIVIGIALFVYGCNADEGGFISGSLAVFVITAIFFIVVVGINVDLYVGQLKLVKGMEKEIPLNQEKLRNLEQQFASENPKVTSEYQEYLIKRGNLEGLRDKIMSDKIKYVQEFNQLKTRNSWTNIFVLTNGKFEGEQVNFSD